MSVFFYLFAQVVCSTTLLWSEDPRRQGMPLLGIPTPLQTDLTEWRSRPMKTTTKGLPSGLVQSPLTASAYNKHHYLQPHTMSTSSRGEQQS